MKQQGVPEITTSHPGIDILGPGCRVSPSCTVLRGGKNEDAILIRLGWDCTIFDNVRIVVIDKDVSSQTGVYLGDRVVINVGCYLSGEGGVVIGDDVMLGPHVQILSIEHDMESKKTPMVREPVVIEAGAWIGAGAIILPGRRVGAGAVVGAGSVVTCDVPPMTVVVGNPAKVMRRRVESIPQFPAEKNITEEYAILKLIHENLQDTAAGICRERDLLQTNYAVLEKGYSVLENGYREVEKEYQKVVSHLEILQTEYSKLEDGYSLLQPRYEALERRYIWLEGEFGTISRDHASLKAIHAEMVQLLASPSRLTKHWLRVVSSSIVSKIRSLSWRIRRFLRLKPRWDSIQDRYRQSGSAGVALLFYEFFKRKWKERGTLSQNRPGPAMSLDAAKIRLRQQAEAGFRDFWASEETLRFSPGNSPWLSIVLVLWGQAELTLTCLRALAEQAGEGVEIVIVDNASPDETSRLLDRVDGATILRNQENTGFLLAANQGAMAATAPYLLFLNNDAVPRPGSLERARAILDTDPGIGAVGGRILLPDGRLQEAGCVVWRNGSCAGYLRNEAPEIPEALFRRDVDFCSGVFLMTRTGLFQKLGGFDEAFAPAYYEEVDFCLRLWEGGSRVTYDPWIVVDHYEYGSAGSSEAALQRMAANQERFRAKHAETLADRDMPGVGDMVRARIRGTSPVRLLYIDDRVPREDLGGGFPRALALLKTLDAHGIFATVVSLAEPEQVPARTADDGLPPGFEVFSGFTPDRVIALLQERQGYYDLLFVSRPSNMERLCLLFADHGELVRDVTILYDAEAIWACRDIAKAAVFGHPMPERQIARVMRKELALARPAACVLAVSEREREVFLQGGYGDVRVLSHAVPCLPMDTPFARRADILFVGALFTEGSPNVDSMLWFVQDVMPLLRQAGLGARLVVVGRNDALPSSFASLEDVLLLGAVDDLSPWYARCRIFVAPTRFSAGIPLKVVEAAGSGMPVVATSLLARQLGWNNNVELLVGDDAETFAAQCLRLYREQDLWEKVQTAALHRVNKEYSQEYFHNVVETLLADYPFEGRRREST